MFQDAFGHDYSIAGVGQSLFHRWNAPAPWGSQMPALWAEEEQADEDEKTTQEVEEEKRKDKKRGQQDDKPQPQQPQKNPGMESQTAQKVS